MLEFIDSAYSFGYGLFNAMLIRIEYPAVTCTLFLLLEFLLPRQRNSLASYLRGAQMIVVGVAINTLVLTFLTMFSGTEQVAAGSKATTSHAPLAFLDLSPMTKSADWWVRFSGYAIATVGISFVSDFFYYWMHRAQHSFSWFWRFHRVHHSIVEMNATNSYHHVAEDLFQFVAVTIPMSYLLGVESGPVPWLVIVLLNMHSYFIHSTVNLNIGPFRYVFSDNRVHRIHHSIEAHHINANFATTTPIWDMLFGTARFPARDEWPAVGLTDVAEPRSIRDFLLMPFYGDRIAPASVLDEASRT